ncbi:MAG: hypothetical protein J6M62_05555 [Selenomonadaceae bacterium]|nr:hypothetical protein [Selenomonadaceae bacterium]
MEFAIWIYNALDDGQVKRLMGDNMDLSVRFNEKSNTPISPLGDKKEELALFGSAITFVNPVMEYKRVKRVAFTREPFCGGYETKSLTVFPEEGEYEEIGVSTLLVKGRLYYADSAVADTLKLMKWAAEKADNNGKGFRTVAFASWQIKNGKDAKTTNFRKIVLPKAFIKSYKENYNDKDGMGSFKAVFQQSMSEFTPWEDNIFQVKLHQR